MRKYLGHKEFRNRHSECDIQRERIHKQLQELHKSKLELHRMHRHVKFSPPFIIMLNLLIWFLVFKYTGLRAVGIIFAILFTAGGCMEFLFLRKLESRILTPIERLKDGIEEIAKGNYGVKVESEVHNEIGVLIDSFNEMARELQESERIQNEYEENRKALIASISHDLKTPITAIQGYIEAVTEEGVVPAEDTNKYLRIIYNNTEYMNKLIDDLFLFSKLDMQKLEFSFELVGVRPFVSDLMEEFKLELEDKGICFEYRDRLEEEGCFSIDRKRMNQVLRNLIGNAVKHGSKQGLCIRTELFEADGLACVAVRDNGPGIPKDKLPYIFDRFYRIDTERTKDLSSTGLGLAIAKELVEAHGGRITAESEEGNGTCIIVMLPFTYNSKGNGVQP